MVLTASCRVLNWYSRRAVGYSSGTHAVTALRGATPIHRPCRKEARVVRRGAARRRIRRTGNMQQTTCAKKQTTSGSTEHHVRALRYARGEARSWAAWPHTCAQAHARPHECARARAFACTCARTCPHARAQPSMGLHWCARRRPCASLRAAAASTCSARPRGSRGH